jgi:aspartate/methionine/tyrosine aminotransferase
MAMPAARIILSAGEAAMKYSPEFIQTMRDALEAVMATVPANQSVVGLKAAVAEYILQTAAHDQTSFDGLVASASSQLQAIISMLS